MTSPERIQCKLENINFLKLVKRAHLRGGTDCLIITESVRGGSEVLWPNLMDALEFHVLELDIDHTIVKTCGRHKHLFVKSSDGGWSKIEMIYAPNVESLHALLVGMSPSIILVTEESGFKKSVYPMVRHARGGELTILEEPSLTPEEAMTGRLSAPSAT